MPMLTTAIEDKFLPRSIITDGGDFGETETEREEQASCSTSREEEVHQNKKDIAMSALAGKLLASLSVSSKKISMPPVNDCILSEAIDQWDALSHREKGAAYKVSAADGRWDDFVERYGSKISSYFYAIVDGKGLDRRIASVALSYLKIFLARCSGGTKGVRQLAMLTSLYVAIKIHSGNTCKNGRPNVLIAEVVVWSGNTITSGDISTMEASMLNTLDFMMNPPVPQHFLDIIAPLLFDGSLITPLVKHHIMSMSNWFCEISVTNSYFLGVNPSSVAYAAILVAMDTSSAGGSLKCWFESLDLKHDAYITLQCYEKMCELYCLLEDESPDESYRCLSPTEVVMPLGI